MERNKKLVMLTTRTGPVQRDRLDHLLDRCRLAPDEGRLDYSALATAEIEELWHLVAQVES